MKSERKQIKVRLHIHQPLSAVNKKTSSVKSRVKRVPSVHEMGVVWQNNP